MKDEIYELRFMRWKVSKTFLRDGQYWALLKCVSKRKQPPWEVPLSFLEMVQNRKIS
ncbi:hypothetical protein [Brevibacillus choshinensis]|uniref:Transposase n=1 Tax=Brevibacillus choshinensis TaxID=54911 RepID=A0ABX7FS61_BRECH|nr:hypothetical protein [Brevibacillus choshinensis]QRG68570.1 hypothetical protein JNE38_05295 [Brevibacillus choshinensis]